jgi:hypothetical protein
MDLSPKALRAQFNDMTSQAAAIRAITDPLRVERDAHVNAARDIELAMNAKIKELEAPLFDLDNSRAMLVRALGGKTGEPSAEQASEEQDDATAQEQPADAPIADAAPAVDENAAH